jgi:predicted nucleic acid-binding protein
VNRKLTRFHDDLEMANVLVDTSVWIDFLRSGDQELAELLTRNRVVMHPMIIGELACGNLSKRRSLLKLWSSLDTLTQASHEEVLYFIEHHRLMGRGIGYVDAHLLASVVLTGDVMLWTRDKCLENVVSSLLKRFV